MADKKPHVLVVLDGFGINKKTQYNAIAQANTPTLDFLTTYPHTQLKASGTAVGLLPNMIGNSEVGHITIGAGRIIQQPVVRISKAIDDKSFFNNDVLLKNFAQLKNNNGVLHVMGLLSDAGVHSHTHHLQAFITAAIDNGITNIVIHPFLDGRDVPPQSAQHYLQELEIFLQKSSHGTIGSIHGRFYAMDRDNNNERTQKSIDVFTHSSNKTATWHKILDNSYAKNVTDEFIEPTQLHPNSHINNGDGVIFFNFRPDRARQLTQKLLATVDLSFLITPVDYGNSIKTTYLFEPPIINNTLKEVLQNHNKIMFTAAETEKYAHVTYFFDGGKEQALKNETRKLIPSVAAKNYIDNPCMSAPDITKAVLESLEKDPKDFYLVNYANADMVGHSGNLAATIKAVECLDKQLKKLYSAVVEQMQGTLYITADHGNAEDMFDELAQQPRTSHTTNPVPFIVVNHAKTTLTVQELADIAPYILHTMNVAVPQEMQR